MSLHTVTHINLRGQARQALAFYQSVFGGESTIVTYRDGGRLQDPADADHVMWGQVRSAGGFHLMAYDVQAHTPWHPGENAYYISLRGDDAPEIRARWDMLAAGATILQPLGPAAWSALYGMLKDRFGITWVVDLTA